jgi:hypothetical protein
MSNETVVPTIAVRHERVRDYRTEFVNGVATTGPLADGFFRLTFFRDAIPALTEVFDSVPGDPSSADMTKAHPINVQIFREDLLTLVVTPEIALRMGQDLISMAAPHIEAV